jgi:prepilin-type N-terminal cleavage/methylation domain-containing protein
MSIKRQSQAGMSLVEMMVAIAVGVIVLGGTVQLYWASTSAFLAQLNYVDLDNQSRLALDQMSQQIRQSGSLTTFSSTNLTLVDVDGVLLNFTYDPISRQLIRSKGNRSTVLLNGCNSLEFSIFQRNPVGGNGDFVSATNAAAAKLVQVTWNCSRDALQRRAHTECIQTAKVMMRNKK